MDVRGLQSSVLHRALLLALLPAAAVFAAEPAQTNGRAGWPPSCSPRGRRRRPPRPRGDRPPGQPLGPDGARRLPHRSGAGGGRPGARLPDRLLPGGGIARGGRHPLGRERRRHRHLHGAVLLASRTGAHPRRGPAGDQAAAAGRPPLEPAGPLGGVRADRESPAVAERRPPWIWILGAALAAVAILIG